MIKKFVTLMMVVALFTVQAHAATQSGLKAAFDELNYAMTVEWDQKDQEFYNAQMKKFTSTLRDLQAQGLKNTDIVSFVKSEVKDAKLARDVETALNMISINKMSAEDASKYMMETLKGTYSTGASFAGEILIYGGLGLLLIGAAIAVGTGSAGGGYYGGCYYGSYISCDYWGCYEYCY